PARSSGCSARSGWSSRFIPNPGNTRGRRGGWCRMSSDPLARNASNTALWAAAYRARENDRPNPLFRDPFARRLAGTRGQRIAETLTASDSWAWVTRTYLFDRFIRERIAQDTDTVVNL